MEMTTTPMSNDEIVENLKTMGFGKQAFERFNVKERETLDKAWNIIDQYETRLKTDMMAILTELQQEIDGEAWTRECLDGSDEKIVEMESVNEVIQQKINNLKES